MSIPLSPVLWYFPERALKHRRRPLLQTRAAVVPRRGGIELSLMVTQRAAAKRDRANVKERPINIVHLTPLRFESQGQT
jgi:hypothetical protein